MRRHLAELRSEGRSQRLLEVRVIERFLKCVNAHHGFARIYCPKCRHDCLLAWRHSGFSVHNAVRVRAGDLEGRKKLAQYMLRAPGRRGRD